MKNFLYGSGMVLTMFGAFFLVVPVVWSVLDWIAYGVFLNGDVIGRALIVGLCALVIGLILFGISKYIEDGS